MKALRFGQHISFLFFLIMMLGSTTSSAETDSLATFQFDSTTTAVDSQSTEIVVNISTSAQQEINQPNRIIKKFIDKVKRKKKIVAAALAFPVPFGIIGLHRIYLGTKPYVPLIYIGTLGGALGILPLIDFIIILVEKDITRFEKNDKVFMWVK